MKDQVLGLNISLLVHGVILAAFFILGQGKLFEHKPIVIDLSIVSRGISSGAAVNTRPIQRGRGQGMHLKPDNIRDMHSTPPRVSDVRKENPKIHEPSVIPQKKIQKTTALLQPKSAPKLVPYKQPAPEKIKPISQDKTQQEIPRTVQPRTEKKILQASLNSENSVRKNADSVKIVPDNFDSQVLASGTYNTPSDNALQRSTSVLTGLGGPGQDEDNPGNVGKAYINIHFNYLRERIRKNLCYPKIARKMGWDGKVWVGFTILKNGHVDNLEIKKSCGIKILDRSALETVRLACPFPEPPAVAKIVIPIVYKLN